jgi:hypothetical protein
MRPAENGGVVSGLARIPGPSRATPGLSVWGTVRRRRRASFGIIARQSNPGSPAAAKLFDEPVREVDDDRLDVYERARDALTGLKAALPSAADDIERLLARILGDRRALHVCSWICGQKLSHFLKPLLNKGISMISGGLRLRQLICSPSSGANATPACWRWPGSLARSWSHCLGCRQISTEWTLVGRWLGEADARLHSPT